MYLNILVTDGLGCNLNSMIKKLTISLINWFTQYYTATLTSSINSSLEKNNQAVIDLC